MCYLLVLEEGIPLDIRHVRNGEEPNQEGSGLAIVTDFGLYTEKSLGSLADRFAELRAEFPDGPAMYHARLSTASAVTQENLHPMFPAGDYDTAIAHNGAFPYSGYALEPGESDTALFASETFPQLFSDLDDEVSFGLMEQWMRPWNKVAFITVNPRYRKNLYITHAGQWLRSDDGALHSNPEYLGKGPGWDETTDSDGDLWRWRVPQPGMCPVCWLRNCEGGCERRFLLPALRNESERRRIVQAATEKAMA